MILTFTNAFTSYLMGKVICSADPMTWCLGLISYCAGNEHMAGGELWRTDDSVDAVHGRAHDIEIEGVKAAILQFITRLRPKKYAHNLPHTILQHANVVRRRSRQHLILKVDIPVEVHMLARHHEIVRLRRRVHVRGRQRRDACARHVLRLRWSEGA